MSLEDLRAKFLALNAEETVPFDVVVDRDLDAAVKAARDALTAARAARDDLAEKRQEALAAAHDASHDDDDTPKRVYALAGEDAPPNPVAEIDDQIRAADQAVTDAETALAQAQADAKPATVSLLFGRLAPAAYAALVAEHSDEKGDVNYETFVTALAAACYRHAEDEDGTDMGIGWDDAREGALTDGDLLILYPAVVAHNRKLTIHPR